MFDHFNEPAPQKVSRIEKSLSRLIIISMCALTFYASISIMLDIYILAIIQLAVLITLPALYIWLKQGASHTTIKHIIGFASLMVFLPLFFTPSIGNASIYWVFIYPLITFFFLGSQIGMRWNLIYILSIISCLTLAYLDFLPLYYTWTQIFLSLFELIFCSIIAYYFVSDNEHAEKKLQTHIHYLKSIDTVECALHSLPETDKGMYAAIQAIRTIFHTSRACLVAPNNADIANQFMSFESVEEGISSAFTQENPQVISQGDMQILMHIQKSDLPICYDDCNPVPDEQTSLQAAGVQSQMIMRLYPNKDQTWLLILQQCNYTRHWYNDEQYLFRDISRRIEDTLEHMLLYQELKTSTKQLLQAKKEAEAANHAKSEFLSVMSHELRTPLHGIVGLQELIAADASQLSSEQLEHLTLAQQATKSLSGLVNDILDLSKVESGDIPLKHKKFSLKGVLRDAVSPFIIACRNKKLTLQLQLEDVPKYIIGDEVRLRQILLNLIGNAVKFTQEGHINIHITQAGDYLSFAIKDTGIGMSQEMLEKIFMPFHQEAAMMHTERTGTGLGTTIVKRFVELMGGSVQVTSELGVGSCFTCLIPFKATSDKRINWTLDADQIPRKLIISSQDDQEPKHAMQNNIHILLADDDPIGLRIAVKRLKRVGILVDVAEDGFTAWVKSQTGEHDLLLTDIRMPKIDGIELTRRIRQSEIEHNKTRLPIVGLSAHALAEVEQECSDAGMDAFMVKPIEPDKVLKKVQEILEQHKSKNVPPADFTI